MEYFEKNALDFNIDDFEFNQKSPSVKKFGNSPPVKKKKPSASASVKKPNIKNFQSSSLPVNCLRKGKKLIVKIAFPIPIKYRHYYPSHANIWRYIDDCMSIEECGELKSKNELSAEKGKSLKQLLKSSPPPPSPERKKNKNSQKLLPPKNLSMKKDETKRNFPKLKERNIADLATDLNCQEQSVKDVEFNHDAGLSKLKSGALKENGEPMSNKLPLKKRKINLSSESVKNLSPKKVPKYEILDKQCLTPKSVVSLSSGNWTPCDQGEHWMAQWLWISLSLSL